MHMDNFPPFLIPNKYPAFIVSTVADGAILSYGQGEGVADNGSIGVKL